MSWHSCFDTRSRIDLLRGGYARQAVLVLLVVLVLAGLVQPTSPAEPASAEPVPEEPVDDYSRPIEPDEPAAQYRRDLMYDYAYLKKQPSPAPQEEDSMGRFGSSFVQDDKNPDDSAFKGTHPLAPNEILMFLHIQVRASSKVKAVPPSCTWFLCDNLRPVSTFAVFSPQSVHCVDVSTSFIPPAFVLRIECM